MKQFSLLDFVLGAVISGGVVFGLAVLYIAELKKASKTNNEIPRLVMPTPSKGNLSVLIQVKASSDWNFVYGGEIPYGGSLILPTEVGILNFTHSK